MRWARVNTAKGLRQARWLRLARHSVTTPKIWSTRPAPAITNPMTACQVGTSDGCASKVPRNSTTMTTAATMLRRTSATRNSTWWCRHRRSRCSADGVGVRSRRDWASAHRAWSPVTSGATVRSIAAQGRRRSTGTDAFPQPGDSVDARRRHRLAGGRARGQHDAGAGRSQRVESGWWPVQLRRFCPRSASSRLPSSSVGRAGRHRLRSGTRSSPVRNGRVPVDATARAPLRGRARPRPPRSGSRRGP